MSDFATSSAPRSRAHATTALPSPSAASECSISTSACAIAAGGGSSPVTSSTFHWRWRFTRRTVSSWPSAAPPCTSTTTLARLALDCASKTDADVAASFGAVVVTSQNRIAVFSGTPGCIARMNRRVARRSQSPGLSAVTARMAIVSAAPSGALPRDGLLDWSCDEAPHPEMRTASNNALTVEAVVSVNPLHPPVTVQRRRNSVRQNSAPAVVVMRASPSPRSLPKRLGPINANPAAPSAAAQ